MSILSILKPYHNLLPVVAARCRTLQFVAARANLSSTVMISSKLRIGESCTYEVTLPRTQHSRILHQSASSTSTPPPDSPPLTLTQEMCLEILEHAASTPWVPMEHTSSNQVTPEDRLQRAFGRGFQILKFLGRLQDEEVGGQFLDDFEKAPLETGSDIARARVAIAIIIDTIVRDIHAVPLSSALRTKHCEVFDVFGALVPLYDAFRAQEELGIDQPAWAEFWSKGQYILITLMQKLDECGLGIQEDR